MALRAFFNSVISGTAPFRTYVLVGFSVMALTAIVLFAMGREPICKCGEVWLWSGDIVSANNSQHLLDPYSFTHIEHGFGFYVLLKFAAGGMPLPLRAFFAIALESGWEVLENTDLVINKYREDTISLGYFGDSIVNSLSDILMNVIGFVLAARLRARTTVFVFLAIESFLLFWIRDNLILNIVMLIYPLSAIKAWQLGG